MPRLQKATPIAGAGVLLLALMFLAAGRLNLVRHEKSKNKEVLLVPSSEIIRHMDLGHHTLAADLLLIRANIYYGEHMLTDEQLPWLNVFVDVLLGVDPKFKKAYFWSSLVTLYQERKVSNVEKWQVIRANQILAQGMKEYPQDYRFPARIAFNLYYELGELEKSLPYFQQAARLPDAPPWLEAKLVDLYLKKGEKQLARKLFESMLADTVEEELSSAMLGRLNLLLDPDTRARLEALRKQLVREWKSDYPYLAFDLFLLVREP